MDDELTGLVDHAREELRQAREATRERFGLDVPPDAYDRAADEQRAELEARERRAGFVVIAGGSSN